MRRRPLSDVAWGQLNNEYMEKREKLWLAAVIVSLICSLMPLYTFVWLAVALATDCIVRPDAEGGTRTPTSCLTRPSNVRVYQFRHFR